MKIFISWSGERSRIIAEGLNGWLPKVIQAVKPFYSPEIEKGTKGIEEINKTLEGTSFGIICLTRDNLESTWIHYEAGALSKIEGARIWTLLFNLKYSDVAQPLAQFQHTLANKADIYKLLDSINIKLSEPLEKSVLRDSFERWWSDFEDILKQAKEFSSENQNPESIRSDRNILNEVLEILRSQQRGSGWLTGKLTVLKNFVGLFRLNLLTYKPLTETDFEKIENHISDILDEPEVQIHNSRSGYSIIVKHKEPVSFADVDRIAAKLTAKFPNKFECKAKELVSLE